MASNFTALPPRPAIRDPFAKASKGPSILKPPVNPILGRYSQFFQQPKVQSGPARLAPGTPRPTQLPPGLNAPGGAPTGAAGQAPGTSATTTAPSPLDSTYFDNVNNYAFNTGNKINSLNSQIGNARTNLQAQLDALDYQQPRDALNLENAANRNGSLFSSVYGQNQGNLAHSYATRRTTATSNEANQEAGLNAQISALQQSIPLYQKGQYDAAVQRAIQAAASNPATGQPPVQAPLTPQQIRYINAGLKGPASLPGFKNAKVANFKSTVKRVK